MHSVLSQDITNADAATGAAQQRRASTTGTLLGVAACLVLAKALALGAPALSSAAAPPHQGVTQGVTPVTIVAPEFCKNQTWPYIEARCLRRVDNPPPADARSASAAPANSAAASPGPVKSEPVNSEPANSAPVLAPPAAAPVIYDGVPPPPAPSPAAAPSLVIQTVFPTAEPGAAPPNDLQSAGADTSPGATPYQRVNDAARPHHARHWRHGFFPFGGFRF
jgi:hypothetical protein